MPQMIDPCPVCGYDGLLEAPTNFSICPCCGTQFDYDDDTVSHDELRRRWVESGARWWSPNRKPPLNWSPLEQLEKAGFKVPVSNGELVGKGTASPPVFVDMTKKAPVFYSPTVRGRFVLTNVRFAQVWA